MSTEFITDQTFKGGDFTKNRLSKAEYENCIFENCDFSNSYLDNQNFMECEFIDCNLSNANIAHTIFKEVVFAHCKLIGLRFEECNAFFMDFTFEDCILNHSSFYGLSLNQQRFSDCKLIGTDFTEAVLKRIVFERCDLTDTLFLQTDLEQADFRTAMHFSIDPDKNNLKKARFSQLGVLGLLNKYDIIVE